MKKRVVYTIIPVVLLVLTAFFKNPARPYLIAYQQSFSDTIPVAVVAANGTATADNDTSTATTTANATGTKEIEPSLRQKLVMPGNHTNIPPPEERIGPNGEKGYVHDPQWLLKNPKKFHIPPDPPKGGQELCYAPGNSTEGAEGIVDVMKIRNHIETSKESRDVKLFCALYTYSGRVHFTDAISETWGRKCDGLLFASDNHSNETGHVLLKSNSRRGFSYKSMIQRVRTMLAYLYDNFLDDYDFFHLSGDDVFMIVENMKEFLASDKVKQWDEVPDQYVFAGFWMQMGDKFYLGGGSGYTISRKALKAYVEGPLQTCETGMEGSAEDLVLMGICLNNFTSKLIYTADSSGAHRYHQSPVWGMYRQQGVKKALGAMQRNAKIPQHFEKHAYTSNSSVTFHRHERPLELRRLELLLYKDLDSECSKFVENNTVYLDLLEAGPGNKELLQQEAITNVTCPLPDESFDANFPTGFPQNLTFGRFRNEKGRPFITQDFWVDIVDNKRTFFLRPIDLGFPSMERLRDWIRSRPHPITLVLNNNHDRSWPEDLDNRTNFELILNETNLHAVYAGNARKLDGYPKLKPLPIGFKWQYRKTTLFGEPKDGRSAVYANNTGTTPEEVETLFLSKERTPTVYFRSMMNSNRRTRLYVRDTPALQMMRYSIPDLLNNTAKNSMAWNLGKITTEEYFQELKKHSFIVSPPGNGLDTHGTWEALSAGCIPIVPKSPLDSLFEDLPVWLVESWDEVTDESVERMHEEMRGKTYKWEKLFVPYWQEEIHRGLCKVSEDS